MNGFLFVWLYFNYSTFLYTDCCCWIELFSLHNLNILWYSFTEIINITFQLLRSIFLFEGISNIQIQSTDIMRTLTEACTVTIAIHEITLGCVCVCEREREREREINCISVFLWYTAKYLNQEYFKELSKFLRFSYNCTLTLSTLMYF